MERPLRGRRTTARQPLLAAPFRRIPNDGCPCSTASDFGQSTHDAQPVDVIIDRKGFWKPIRTLVKQGADSDMLTLRVERSDVMRVLRFVHVNGADVGAGFVRPQHPVAQGTRFSSGNGTGFEHGEWINP